MKIYQKIRDGKSGMALIVALLVSAIVLSIGINIANIAAKQLVLSSFSKESSVALFMADSALECALYWDNTTDHNDPGDNQQYPGRDDSRDYFFKKVANENVSNPGGGSPSVYCFDSTNDLSMQERGNSDNSYPIVVNFDLLQNNDIRLPCASVVITRDEDVVTGGITTTLKTLGYNTCDTNNPRRVERGLEIEY